MAGYVNFDNEIIYHGTEFFKENNEPNLFFTSKNLNNNNESNQAITAGIYFTSSLNTALNYAGDNGTVLNSKNKIEKTKFIYFDDNNDGKGKGSFYTLDSYGRKSKIKFKKSLIKKMIKKSPILAEALSDFGYEEVSDKAINEVVNEYYSNNLDDIVFTLNMIGNDFFRDSDENNNETALINKLFCEEYKVLGIAKNITLHNERHYVFLDTEKLNLMVDLEAKSSEFYFEKILNLKEENINKDKKEMNNAFKL